MSTARRRFMATAGGLMVAATASVLDAPNVIAQPKIQWRMSTTWTSALDVLQGSAERLAKVLDEMSGEPGTTQGFGFNKKAYDALPIDSLSKLKSEAKGKVEVLPLPLPVLRGLKTLAAEVIKTESEKSPMARTVHASFTKFQTLMGGWDHVAESAYHRLVAS